MARVVTRYLGHLRSSVLLDFTAGGGQINIGPTRVVTHLADGLVMRRCGATSYMICTECDDFAKVEFYVGGRPVCSGACMKVTCG